MGDFCTISMVARRSVDITIAYSATKSATIKYRGTSMALTVTGGLRAEQIPGTEKWGIPSATSPDYIIEGAPGPKGPVGGKRASTATARAAAAPPPKGPVGSKLVAPRKASARSAPPVKGPVGGK